MAVGPIVAGATKGAKVAAKFVGQMKQRGKKAMNWFKDTVKKVEKAAAPGKYGRKELLSDEGNLGIVDTPDIGRMYLFQYDPKWKSKLPWYDVWPLIFPFDYRDNGFMGINLHYLPINFRAKLMIDLIAAQAEGEGNAMRMLKLNYNTITSFAPARPCIKRYLFGHVQGKGIYWIGADDWSYAAGLPLQKFKKGGASGYFTGDTKWRGEKGVWKHSVAQF